MGSGRDHARCLGEKQCAGRRVQKINAGCEVRKTACSNNMDQRFRFRASFFQSGRPLFVFCFPVARLRDQRMLAATVAKRLRSPLSRKMLAEMLWSDMRNFSEATARPLSDEVR